MNGYIASLNVNFSRKMKRLDESELSKPPSKVLEVICKLGKGSYGSVFKAKHKASGTVVAVKKVNQRPNCTIYFLPRGFEVLH